MFLTFLGLTLFFQGARKKTKINETNKRTLLDRKKSKTFKTKQLYIFNKFGSSWSTCMY
jgi:hypothetical protein